MSLTSLRRQLPTGHVAQVQRKRGPVWYLRVRCPNGVQERRLLGPAWTRKGRPPDGYYTRQTAERALAVRLAELETSAGEIPARGITFSDAAAEWLRYTEHDRECRPSTLRDYRGTVERLTAAF